nr:extracellular solute-binding protein [Gordonia shandongensis]
MLAACGSGYEEGVLNVYAPTDGFDYVKQFAATCSKESGGRYRIDAHVLPKEADDQRLQLARRLAGNDRSLDLMLMDVVWTAEFANAGWMVPVPDDVAARVEDENLGGPVETAMWKRPDDPAKRLYAIPIWTNTQLLWYRPDLMKGTPSAKRVAQERAADRGRSSKRKRSPDAKRPESASPAPRTWDEMLADTEVIGREHGVTQILVQAKQYEGLMVWFNSLLESAGGSVLDPDDPSTVTLDDTPEHRAATLKALQVMKSVATADGHDPEITQSDEGTARLGMENGKGAFEINWPFVWASARDNAATGNVDFLNDIVAPYKAMLTDEDDQPTDAQLAPVNRKMRAAFDFATYPGIYADEPAKSTLGGFNLAVASTSRQPDLAFEAGTCLTSKKAQKVYAVEGGTPPTIESLYDDADFKLAYPMGEMIHAQLQDGTAAIRPASPQYQAISTLVTAKLSPVGQWDPEEMVDELAGEVRKAVDGEGIIP